ncbi:MAG: type II toxin-antitoxin system VapC family toxin [Phormidesmis sp.]
MHYFTDLPLSSAASYRPIHATKPLLDTNIVSGMMRHPTGAVFQRISEVGEDSICTSIVVICELHFGVKKHGSERLAQRLKDVVRLLPVIALSSPAENYYADARAHLEKSGMPIGPNDLLIAAHALSLDLTVVTANVQEFSRVPGLRVENWL